MSKIDRRNHAKQLRVNKLAQREREESVFAGRDGAPRVVALVPLCEDVNGLDAIASLNASVDVEEVLTYRTDAARRHDIPRFKQKVQYLTPSRDLIDCLDACRVADFVLFLMSATEEVDMRGEQALKCIESQGVSTVLVGVPNLDTVEPAKKRPDVLKSLKSFITHFFATQEKIHDLSNRQDCSNVMRSLCTTIPKGIRWREDRSWMVVDLMQCYDGEVMLTGFVRGRGLKADRLVQVDDLGDFQISKITAAPLEIRRKGQKADVMAVDGPQEGDLLEPPTEEQDDLAELAPEEMTMDDVVAASIAPSERKAVLLDDHHYFDDDDREILPAPKKLPRGTSKYQSAWYVGDVSDSGSDMEDVEDEDEDEDEEPIGPIKLGPADGHFEDHMAEPTEAGAQSEYPQSEAFHDPAPDEEAEQIAAYRKQRKDDAEDDLEFPDEIELHPHVLARERLARYRGLKSIRTSEWETEEDRPHEPADWSRLLEISDYKSAKNRVHKEALVGGVKPGTRVNVHLRVDSEQRAAFQRQSIPKAMFSLLRHEHKRTAINTSITLPSDFDRPLRSKEELLLQCGPRRLVINPLFSQTGNTPNNVHKFDRYLHPGRTAAASFIGPVTWGAVPCLYFKREMPTEPEDAISDLVQDIGNNHDKKSRSGLTLIATGTSMAPSTNRVIAKRIILTGHPYKIHRKLVTVRYMFFNPEDMQYFRALQLWTKRGRSGFMKEALGTHGYFKATFDGKINPMDAVAVSLYKRVWPRNAVRWTPDFKSVEKEKSEDGLGSNEGLGDEKMMSDDPLEGDELMQDEIWNTPEGVHVELTL